MRQKIVHEVQGVQGRKKFSPRLSGTGSVRSVRSVIFVTEATGVDTMSDGCEGCVTAGDGCNCGPQGWPCRGCVNQTSSRLLSLMVSGSSCATCHGYYGSANGQPVCPTCHAFLYANDVDVEANAQVCPLTRFFRFDVCLKYGAIDLQSSEQIS